MDNLAHLQPYRVILTMCVCGENQPLELTLNGNLFQGHLDLKTGLPCPGLKLPPRPPLLSEAIAHRDEMIEYARRTSIRCANAERLMFRHSMFAYPHLFIWHALFDGTWLCRCWHSREMKRQVLGKTDK